MCLRVSSGLFEVERAAGELARHVVSVGHIEASTFCQATTIIRVVRGELGSTHLCEARAVKLTPGCWRIDVVIRRVAGFVIRRVICRVIRARGVIRARRVVGLASRRVVGLASRRVVGLASRVVRWCFVIITTCSNQ